MNRKIMIPALLAGACMMFASPVRAEDAPYVVDNAGLLSTQEVWTLDEAASTLSNGYDCGVYVRITESQEGYSSIEEYAEAVYTIEELGHGADHDGILFVIDMGEREYDIIAHGDKANYAFTDYAKDLMADRTVSYLSSGQYYDAFNAFIDEAEYDLSKAAAGEPVDIWIPDPQPAPEPLTPWEKLVNAFPFIGSIGAAISFFVVNILKGKNKTDIGVAREAREYIAKDGIHLTRRQDIMVNRTVTRTPIQRHEDTSSHSGPGHYGGTTINSGGFSHHSGKF